MSSRLLNKPFSQAVYVPRQTLASYTTRIVTKGELQKKARFFDRSDIVPISRILATFNQASDTICNSNGAAIEVLHIFSKDALAVTLYTEFSVSAHSTIVVALINTTASLIQRNLMQSYLKAVNRIQREFAE